MLNIGAPEFLIILLVALVVLGPERLPGAARQVGKTIGSLRDIAQGFQNELEAATKDASDEIEEMAREAGFKAVEESKAQAAAQAEADHPPGPQDAGSPDSIDPQPAGVEEQALDVTTNGSADIAAAGNEPSINDPDVTSSPAVGHAPFAAVSELAEDVATREPDRSEKPVSSGGPDSVAAAHYPRVGSDDSDAGAAAFPVTADDVDESPLTASLNEDPGDDD